MIERKSESEDSDSSEMKFELNKKLTKEESEEAKDYLNIQQIAQT